ncbi:uncharacterized protein LOC141774440 [Sebastes fasciatus]|uniref:uncharacterized protein LOC141774440 n=1 Tax=Sebastes fasciatus TaxID=394691 RepID=UPI003D9F1DEA
MSSCCVFGCPNRRSLDSSFKFYRIPAVRKRRERWLNAIQRTDWTEAIINNARVCNAHFISGEASMNEDSPDYAPSVFPCGENMERLERKRKRKKQTVEQEDPCHGLPVDDDPMTAEEPVEEAEIVVPLVDYHSLSQKYDQLSGEYGNLRKDFYKLKEENARLKEELRKSNFSFSTVKNNAAHFLFLTGLTSVIFTWLVTKIKESVQKQTESLMLEDHLLVVLMKLRLGLSNRDIAYRFNVSECTISNVLRSWLPVMANVLKSIIKWPRRSAVLKNMPKSFRRHFKRCRCIIDCTEIFIERPTDLNTRAQSWSKYKHNNTVKYLVGITPAGAVSFLSPGCGGSVSDKQITLESGFLHLLEPKDEILAERGFLIRDELAACGATLRVPSFTKGKSPLPACGVDSSRRLSRARVHVERVISRWKSFKILHSVIPVSQVSLLDDMVIVCGALTNLCESVVPRKERVGSV